MKFKENWVHFYIVFCHLAVIFIFLAGFLPFQKKSETFANWETSLPKHLNEIKLNPHELYTPKLTRLVLIVIDALRADFILGKHLQSMPFLSELHQKGQACSYLAQAHSPTVTLPRIKALVTGSVPGFADVIFNLGSSHIGEDNVLDQLSAQGHKLVFYGDDTWLKLFPNKFIRSEGTTSFFVNDFKEVDDNVTRHLDFELNQTDWSVMVLHYLGLDHIGHVSGPRSPLVPLKLKEMDNVIKKIHLQFSKEKTAIIVCGDHGMSDSGSHGGSSKAEVEVPLTFIIEGCKPDLQPKLQIDLAPTMSVLMGVPIPSNNLGSLLFGVIDSFHISHKLYAAFVNAQTIVSRSETNADDPDYQLATKLYHDWLVHDILGNGDKITSLFLNATARISSRTIESLAKFDTYLMVVGIIISFQLFVISCIENQTFVLCQAVRPIGGLVTGIISFFLVASHVLSCLSINNDSSLCLGGQVPVVYSLGLNVFILSLFVFNCNLIFNRTKFCWKAVSITVTEFFLLLGSLLHAASLGASSLVEEEHQTYYFFVSTLGLLLLCRSKKRKSDMVSLIGFMGLVRIARTWNQTGDKWINESDVKEWLNEPVNKPYLAITSVIGATGIFRWFHNRQNLSRFQLVAAAVGLLAILAHRAAFGLFSFIYPQSTGIVEAAVAYLSLIVIGLSSRERPSTHVTIWIILTSLLKRPHNIILTWMQLVQYSLIRPHLASQLRPFYYGLAHYWIGMSWYFQQGNGNNLARIDLASGYVGLTNYNMLAVGFLLSCATFSGPVLALLLVVQNSKGKSQTYGFICSRLLIMTTFFVTIFSLRYHLFIWTVFSPKLLYESALSVVLLVVLLLH